MHFGVEAILRCGDEPAVVVGGGEAVAVPLGP